VRSTADHSKRVKKFAASNDPHDRGPTLVGKVAGLSVAISCMTPKVFGVYVGYHRARRRAASRQNATTYDTPITPGSMGLVALASMTNGR
jgi:hypothetical protein